MYTIKEVSQKLKISAHTLRFYDNQGLFPNVIRNDNNVRLFSEKDLEWVYMVQCLRETDMPLNEIKHYILLCEVGDSSLEERYELILKQKEKAEEGLERMILQVQTLKKKEAYYRGVLNNQNVDCWNPVNEDTFLVHNIERMKQ